MKKLLFTGASGFLGRHIRPILAKSYRVTTLGLSRNNSIQADLAQEIPLLNERYEIVLHAAGKAHIVSPAKTEEKEFFDVNYQGTIRLCKALERIGKPQAFIFISTVAVYGRETGENISEEHPLDGRTPYARSKIKAEEYLRQWAKEQGVVLGIIRPALLAGVDPPGNLGALIRGISSGRYLSIAHGKARKSMLMAEDVAYLLPKLAETGGTYNVCDDHHPSFGELEFSIAMQLGKKRPVSIPYFFAKGLAVCGDILGDWFPINSSKLKKITQTLTFSNKAAKKQLEWTPLPVLENFKINS